jgi:hypothetical protein
MPIQKSPSGGWLIIARLLTSIHLEQPGKLVVAQWIDTTAAGLTVAVWCVLRGRGSSASAFVPFTVANVTSPMDADSGLRLLIWKRPSEC